MNNKTIKAIHAKMRELGYSKNSWEGKRYDSWLWHDKKGITVSIDELKSVSVQKSDETLKRLAGEFDKIGITCEYMQHYLWIRFEVKL